MVTIDKSRNASCNFIPKKLLKHINMISRFKDLVAIVLLIEKNLK
jgi:hypothetical protein